VHRGSEDWAKAIPVDAAAVAKLNVLPAFVYQFLENRLRKTGLFALPWLPRSIERFEMMCELYIPSLSRADLSADLAERETQIRLEAERVRARMIELKDMLRTRAG
jgi:hypothetical protein